METSVSIQVNRATVADTSTIIPGSNNLPFTSFAIPVVGASLLAFYGSNATHNGIYYQTLAEIDETTGASNSLSKVCDLTTGLPTIGNPTVIDPFPVVDDAMIYFKANNGTTQGIYNFNTNNKEIGELYTCPCSEKISKISASEGAVVFEKSNAVTSSDNGIWLINKNNLASVIIKTNPPVAVQINGNPMNPNNFLFATGRPYLEGENLIFVGKLKNTVTGHIGQALIQYNLSAKGLLSILRDGDTLPSGNQLVGDHPFFSELSYRDGHIACNVEYNSSDASSTKFMMILMDSQFTITEITYNDAINPVSGVSLYTSNFERPPMTSGGDVCFSSTVELTTSEPSTNLFGNIDGSLASYISGNQYPLNGKKYLQNISHSGEGFMNKNLLATRCFWNNGQSDHEDNLGIYLFYLRA